VSWIRERPLPVQSGPESKVTVQFQAKMYKEVVLCLMQQRDVKAYDELEVQTYRTPDFSNVQHVGQVL